MTFERNLGLYVGKALVPMFVVDSPWFNRLIMCLDAKIVMTSRRRLVEKILPSLVEEGKGIMRESIKKSRVVSITFDLWITFGSKDVFSVMCHTLSDTFVRESFSVGMISMDGTDGTAISEDLQLV